MSRHSRVIVETTATIPWPEAIGEREERESRVPPRPRLSATRTRVLALYPRLLSTIARYLLSSSSTAAFRPRDRAFPRISRLSLSSSPPSRRIDAEIAVCVYIYIYKEAGGFERATCPPFHLEPVTVANFVPRPNLNAVPFPRTNRAYDDRDRAKSFKQALVQVIIARFQDSNNLYMYRERDDHPLALFTRATGQ